MINKSQLSRRQTLQLLGLSSVSYLLGGCVPPELTGKVGNWTEPLNQRTQEILLKPQALVPEYPVSAIEPQALLINSFQGSPDIDLSAYRLVIDGDVQFPMQLTLADLQKLPLTSMVMRHICVEGWAAIVQWGGIQMSHLAKLAQPKQGVKYVYFQSADQYYESWDLASALHPQTLLAYQKNGAALPLANGAPLRLAAPIKLGYKQSKWVTRVTFASSMDQARRGYWEDRGYEWFAGL
jgi:DMSO/TMAO reductase YedYZ molybdopterin-dependent catalytic subunit